jgi:hypothetical protein
MSEFKRELRYFVLKIAHIKSEVKDISVSGHSEKIATKVESHLHELKSLLAGFYTDKVTKRNYVVVQDNWPEYEVVWNIIRMRMEGLGSGKQDLLEQREQFETIESIRQEVKEKDAEIERLTGVIALDCKIMEESSDKLKAAEQKVAAMQSVIINALDLITAIRDAHSRPRQERFSTRIACQDFLDNNTLAAIKEVK